MLTIYAQDADVIFDNVTINNSASETYIATNSITANNFIVEGNGLSGGSATMTAGMSITWSPGFHAKAGSEVTASIDPSLVNITVNNLVTGTDENQNIDLTVTGGYQPYAFLWNTGATTEDLAGIGYGRYSVTITDQQNNNQYETIDIMATTSKGGVSLLKNWIRSTAYNENGNIIADSKTFSNELGKVIQVQSRSFTNNNTLATQTIYDAYGRAVLTSLPAPTNSTGLNYKADFFCGPDGSEYSYTDFDLPENIYNPEPVHNTFNGSVGKYYSNSSPEDYVPASSYPYTRVEYSKTQPGAIRKITLAGEAFRLGQGHEIQSYTMPAHADELSWLVKQAFNPELEGMTKTITVDPDGKESITYYSASGNTISTCISGGAKFTINRGMPSLDAISYIDIHVPENCMSDLHLYYPYSDIYYDIIDLSNDKIYQLNYNTQPSGLNAGFYRIVRYSDNGYPTNVNAIKYNLNYQFHSLYYYDKAGRLISSFSPKGVENNHTMQAKNEYNSLGWLTATESVDEGRTEYIYRIDGSIRFSQNAHQRVNGNISYTNYDKAGRIIEVGEFDAETAGWFNTGTDPAVDDFTSQLPPAAMPSPDPTPTGDDGGGGGTTAERSFSSFNPYWLVESQYCHEQTFTEYDIADPGLSSLVNGYNQHFTAGRATKTRNDKVTTWYSYDYMGRIEWVVQKYPELNNKFVTINYTYDFNGNVLSAIYQKDNYEERFDHIYTYDADLRLIKVQTAKYGQWLYSYANASPINMPLGSTYILINDQAEYFYYPHGALKRVELAEDLQGIDYVYTINGWLKSINNPALGEQAENNPLDPGKDGFAGSIHSNFAEDVFGMSLDYYSGDYIRKNTHINYTTTDNNLYNGNIVAQRWQTAAYNSFNSESGIALTGTGQWMYKYTYNNRNWLSSATFGKFTPDFNVNANKAVENPNKSSTNAIFASMDDYLVSNLTYGPNGNIKTLSRNAYHINGTPAMDNFTYNYSVITGGPTNRLINIVDAVTSHEELNDLKAGQTASDNNYHYNSIGQMTADVQENRYFDYDVYGKVTAIYSDAAHTNLIVRYEYDDKGYRIRKFDNQNNTDTWYFRDISGNILHIAEYNTVTLLPKEYPVYGASRIGTFNMENHKNFYSLSDHLGNVRATISKSLDGLKKPDEAFLTKPLPIFILLAWKCPAV
ncbi:MAG: hypothetical protein GXO84_10135 [Chlorobi bacterium]|nr:hypothetical protein [Chlorobiota bacterium]